MKMKKVISLLLVFALCLSLCACGGGKKITAKAVEEAVADCDGTLNMDASGDKVTGFTYVVEDVNADDLMDKDYCRTAMSNVLSGDTSKITFGQIKVSKAISAVMCVEGLFASEKENSDVSGFVDTILGMICNGNTADHGDWTVSVDVDQANDSITIHANSK